MATELETIESEPQNDDFIEGGCARVEQACSLVMKMVAKGKWEKKWKAWGKSDDLEVDFSWEEFLALVQMCLDQSEKAEEIWVDGQLRKAEMESGLQQWFKGKTDER